MLFGEKKMNEGYLAEKRVFQKERTFEEDYPDLLTYKNEVLSWIDNRYERIELKSFKPKVFKLLSSDKLIPWVEEIVKNVIQDCYNEQTPADDCWDEIVEKIEKEVNTDVNESADTEYTDETWDNDVEFETQFIYNELKTWLKSFKDTEFSVYKGVSGTDSMPQSFIRIYDGKDNVIREIMLYEDEGDIFLKIWYGSSISKRENYKTYKMSTIKNITEFCKNVIMDIRSNKILYPKVEESVNLLRNAGYIVEKC